MAHHISSLGFALEMNKYWNECSAGRLEPGFSLHSLCTDRLGVISLPLCISEDLCVKWQYKYLSIPQVLPGISYVKGARKQNLNYLNIDDWTPIKSFIYYGYIVYIMDVEYIMALNPRYLLAIYKILNPTCHVT